MSDPILVVGAGPTGLTAALELSRLGIPVRLIDKAAHAATTSRAIGVQARTLELLQQRGLAAELMQLGNPAQAASVYGGGRQLARMDFSHVDSRFDTLLLVSQATTEHVLGGAVRRAGVVVERGVELVALAQDADGAPHEAPAHDRSPVHAVLRHADGRLEATRAPWLISAEGAHSLVRSTLDLHFDGRTLDEQFVLGDVLLDGDPAETDLHIFSSAHGFMGLFPMGGRRFRVIAGNAPEPTSRDADPSLDELQRLYDQRSHIPATLRDLTWSAWFRINSRMVQRLRVGRLLLGGDAAHIHSPAGAQGMNTGIQDMINLCWKLALVQTGQAGEALLDSYEQDRLPVIRDVLFRTGSLTGLIGSENPLLRGLVNRLAPVVSGSGLVQENGTAQVSQVAIGYRDSPLSSNHAHNGSLQAGDRVPDFTVLRRSADGWSEAQLLDLLDPSRFVLLVAHGDESTPLDARLAGVAAVYGDLAVLVELAPVAEAAARARYEAMLGRRSSVFLVRPDGYVGMAAGEHAAARHLAAYRKRWCVADA